MKEIQILNNGESLHSIRTKINENFELVNEKTVGLTKFCVNSGNTENDLPDLLQYEGNMISFKVGGEYENVVATNGDNATFTRDSLQDVGVNGLADGTYKIFIDDQSAEIGTGEIYSQFIQPENMQYGDIWFNGVTARKYEQSALQVVNSLNITNTSLPSEQLQSVAYGNNMYVTVSYHGNIYTSTNKIDWVLRTSGTTSMLNRVKFLNGKFFVCGSEIILTSQDGITWTTSHTASGVSFMDIIYDGQKYIVVGSGGVLRSSTNGVNWAAPDKFTTSNIKSICFGNNLYVAACGNGNIYTSPNSITWTLKQSGITNNINTIKYLNGKYVAAATGYILHSEDGDIWYNTFHNITFNDVDFIDNEYLFLGSNGLLCLTSDFSELNTLNSGVDSTLLGISDNIVVGTYRTILELKRDSGFVPFEKVPVGEVVKSGGTIVEAITYPYNVNGLTMASNTNYGMLRVAAEQDETNCSCTDAGITPSNLYKLNGFRTANTEYNVEDVVGCPYHSDIQLKCIKEGTTSTEALNTKGELVRGQTINDGTVIWQVENVGTGNGSIIGTIIPVNASSNYVPEGTLPCDGAEYSKAQFEQLWDNYLIGKDVFDPESITIEGNPTITDEGIASGFSNANYLTSNKYIFENNGKSFVIKGKIKTGADITSNANFFASQNRGVSLNIENGKTCLFLSTDNTNWNLANHKLGTYQLSANTEYYIEFSFDGLKYVYSISEDGVNYINDIVIESTEVVPNSTTPCRFGCSFGNIAFTGSIDLKEFSITVDGQTVFDCLKNQSLLNTCTYEEYEQDLATYGQCGKFAVKPLEYDSNSVLVVGTPTITEDGIASGFGADSCLTLPSIFNPETKPWKIIIKATLGDVGDNNYRSLLGTSIQGTDNQGVAIAYRKDGNGLTFWFSSNGIGWDLGSVFGRTTFDVGETFYTKVEFTGTSYECSVSKDNVNWISQGSINSSIPIYVSSQPLAIGDNKYGQAKVNFWTGSIDLKEFLVEVDGQTVFDCVDGDTFRVPTIKDGAVVQQAMSDGELGKAYNEGLPDHTHSPIMLNGSNADDGDSGSLVITAGSQSNGIKTIKSSSTGSVVETDVYTKTDETSLNKVQMNAVALRYFVVVANGQLNESAMNWSEWASNLQSKANKTDVDGQWVASTWLLSNTVSAGTYTIDLSEYLPNDGNNYDVKIFGYCVKTGSTASNVYIYTAIDNLKTYSMMATASSRQGRFYSIFTVDTTRTITMEIDLDVATLLLTAFAYRRIGRNV